ncbi:MAG: 1,4-alpha-glucan branching protein [Bryobacterales bacterium]|nr:1,4-alpha-glucan branching protein [Bryobacterales bacterium]
MIERKLPIGAEVQTAGGVHFRVWAPHRKEVRIILENGPGSPATITLAAEADGYFSGVAPKAAPGTVYRFELDQDSSRYPDPASRFQPDGPHGPSRVVDGSKFEWTDNAWQGVKLEGQILYEIHIGTFTKDGNWKAAEEQLEELAAAGITCVEIMPVADFPGRFGWGYDGVNLFAPSWLYGEPDDFRAFIDEAHSVGIGVILDVVYNHFGPDGNYLKCFAEDYFTDKYVNDWGDAINFDGRNCGPVREYFVANAQYWIEEFHLDGLRLDATQQIFDDSPEHILKEITKRIRTAAGGRSVIQIAENEPQDTKLVRAFEKGGYEIDALWNDDFHHSAIVTLTGRNEAYYSDYLGSPQEYISCAKYGYLYQGQWYQWQEQRRGTASLDLKPCTFVTFIQNHDQVANTLRGERADRLGAVGKFKAMTTLLLLGPGTPMLFMGQEFAASTPFLYFCDHRADLSKQVREGRAQFLGQFRSLALSEVQSVIPDPGNPSTFHACKLDFTERQKNEPLYDMHKDLMKLRRGDPVFRAQRIHGVDGAVLGAETFLLRYFGDEHGDRLLLVNFGRDLHLDPAPEPLLAPPHDRLWRILWSSEDPQYGGNGTFPPDSDDNWRLPGYAAVVLTSEPETKKGENGE